MTTIEALVRSTGDVVTHARELEMQNARLRNDCNKLSDQLKDAMDKIYELGIKVREQDEVISEMQQIGTARRTGR